jgi:hypothetical protein
MAGNLFVVDPDVRQLLPLSTNVAVGFRDRGIAILPA